MTSNRNRSLRAAQILTAGNRRGRGEIAEQIKLVRQELNLSQGKFAEMFGLEVRVLQNWEQGRSLPEGASASYLWLIIRHPNEVLRLQSKQTTSHQPASPTNYLFSEERNRKLLSTSL